MNKKLRPGFGILNSANALTTKDIQRFWEKVLIGRKNQCWPWVAGRSSTNLQEGYGCFRIGHSMKRSHRVSWYIKNGPIPVGKLVCHRCDNPICVNPNHLFIGTDKDNGHDRKIKGRNPDLTGERNGRAKIKRDDARVIRESYAAWIKNIASTYHITGANIRDIINKKIWLYD